MMSDREKTVIDCVDRPELAGGLGEVAHIVAMASRRLDWAKTAEYLERISSGALARRFGWLVDYVKADLPTDVRGRLLTLASRNRKTWLGSRPDREVPGAIGFDQTWRVFVNVRPDELHGSTGLGRRKKVKKAL
jgi:predicted transcriptional regulator of viral defense system